MDLDTFFSGILVLSSDITCSMHTKNTGVPFLYLVVLVT